MGNKDDTRDVLPEELRLEDNMPEELCYDIIEWARGNEHYSCVYRVAKWGKIEESAFLNTYGEIQEGMEILYDYCMQEREEADCSERICNRIG